MRLLKQTTTGDIYPWTPQLAERPDMVEVGKEPEMPEPVRHVEVAEEAIELQPDVPSEEIPTENSESASAEDLPPLDDAIESFRRQASKTAKKKADENNG